MVNIAINGFGRIGRLFLRASLLKYPKVNVAAVNTSGSMDMKGWFSLFKYDTVYGKFPKSLAFEKRDAHGEIGVLALGEKRIPFLAERDPQRIPWGNYNASVVVESTGVFRTKEEAGAHLRDTVKRVIISAPPKDDETPLVMLGINENNAHDAPVVSNCSCTTYSAASIVKIINDHFGVKLVTLTTIHAYTADQRLIDGSHKRDVRRARSAPNNIIPTTSGAAKAVTAVIPELKGKFNAVAIRVPVITGSISDLTFVLNKPVQVEEVRELLTVKASEEYKRVLAVTEEPLVSSDIIGNSASAIIDLPLTSVIDSTLLKIFSWYDNEWSYACRLAELTAHLGDKS